MPIHTIKKPDGSRRYKWGRTGKQYRSRQDAVKQMRAIYASGWKGHQKKAGLDSVQLLVLALNQKEDR